MTHIVQTLIHYIFPLISIHSLLSNSRNYQLSFWEKSLWKGNSQRMDSEIKNTICGHNILSQITLFRSMSEWSDYFDDSQEHNKSSNINHNFPVDSNAHVFYCKFYHMQDTNPSIYKSLRDEKCRYFFELYKSF